MMRRLSKLELNILIRGKIKFPVLDQSEWDATRELILSGYLGTAGIAAHISDTQGYWFHITPMGRLALEQAENSIL